MLRSVTTLFFTNFQIFYCLKLGLVMIIIYLQADCCQQNADVASTRAAVRMQSVDEPESSAQDASQYAVIYQALDPTTLD